MRAAAIATVTALTLPGPALAQEEPARCDPLSDFACVYAPGPGNAELRTVIDAAEWEALPFRPWSAMSPVDLAPGVVDDREGPAVAGSSSLESIYELDGLDISGVRLGGSTGASPLPLGFSRRMIVRRGGLGAALRGGTGGVISMESPFMHGFGLTAYIGSGEADEPAPIMSAPQPIAWSTSRGNAETMGWYGGPAMDGRLHWRVGFGWRDRGGTTRRTFHRMTDRDADGVPDLDENGVAAVEPVDTLDLGRHSGAFLPASVHVEFNPDDDQQLSATGFVAYDWYFRHAFEDGEPAALARRQVDLTTDLVATWQRRLGSTTLSATGGVHRLNQDSRSPSDERNRIAGGYLRLGSDFLAYESAAVQQACSDGAGDDYPGIVNCPLLLYWANGVGAIRSDPEARWTGRIAATHPLQAGGKHTLQAGAEVEAATYARHVELSGGYYTLFLDEVRFVDLGQGSDQCAGESCRWIAAADLPSQTSSYGLYLADDWSPIDSVTLSAGGRLEVQQVDGLGALTDVAPRLSAAWDPLGHGRSRLFVFTGSYLGRMPMAFNDVAFAGLDTFARTIDPDTQEVVAESVTEFTPTAAATGLGPLRVNELVAGGEVALGHELRAGISYLRRDLGRILEDAGTGSGGLVIANPAARRDHDELAVELRSNPRRPLALRASYTWMRLRGDWQGFLTDDTLQIAPGLINTFDIPELAANTDGRLPPERTHAVDVAAAYGYELPSYGRLTAGVRATAWSGTPWNALGRHPTAGPGEVHILPRGSLGPTPPATAVNLRLAYSQQRMTLFVDIFNLFNRQAARRIDERYTFDQVGPIVGGTPDDLPFLKTSDTNQPVTRNPFFGEPTARYAPFSIWLGMRITN